MKQKTPPGRGEIWVVDLHPVRGHVAREQWRALVISVNELNHGPAGLATVLPLSDVDQRIATHVKVPIGEAGQTQDGFVKCEEMRSVSIERLTNRVGAVKAATLAAVMRNVGVLLGV
ncbi:MAG: type II toxin-antitoxin system PemK/MazF family toxin [Gemmatimonadaceae bacterium]|nr:type II toxin-antitoxin system PemK/MazF family toxin [Gemmatimonadaceae bacterium]